MSVRVLKAETISVVYPNNCIEKFDCLLLELQPFYTFVKGPPKICPTGLKNRGFGLGWWQFDKLEAKGLLLFQVL